MTPRLLYHYQTTIRPSLQQKFQFRCIDDIPSLKKISIQLTSREALADKKQLIPLKLLIELLTGQKPNYIKAKKSIASFNLREGKVIGWKVTLRGDKMYHFLDKLVNTALPRIRELKPFSDTSIVDISLTNSGVMSLGIKDINCFPEIELQFEVFQKIIRNYPIGFHINFTTTAKTAIETKALLTGFQVPFHGPGPKAGPSR